MKIMKIEGTVKELSELYGTFRLDDKKPSNSIDDKNFSCEFKSQKEIEELVEETIAKLRKKEFKAYDICNFLSTLKSEINYHSLEF